MQQELIELVVAAAVALAVVLVAAVVVVFVSLTTFAVAVVADVVDISISVVEKLLLHSIMLCSHNNWFRWGSNLIHFTRNGTECLSR